MTRSPQQKLYAWLNDQNSRTDVDGLVNEAAEEFRRDASVNEAALRLWLRTRVSEWVTRLVHPTKSLASRPPVRVGDAQTLVWPSLAADVGIQRMREYVHTSRKRVAAAGLYTSILAVVDGYIADTGSEPTDAIELSSYLRAAGVPVALIDSLAA